MNAIQQKCRPKHQVLILKCYPRTTKGAVDVKPNSSELSYLLFYATSRRSKIQKVGQYLEKKTASDVWRQRIGNVQVTLQILAALIEKSPKDLPLFASNVLKVFSIVLRSNDITMVEASLPAFKTFCENHDVSALLADQTYLKQYEEIVRSYSAFASTRQTPGKGTPSKPVAVRWRNAGLEALTSIARSDCLSSPKARQFDVIVPMVLENLWKDNDEFLNILVQRIQVDEKTDTSNLLRRRISNATVKTTGSADPITVTGSADDADRKAEEDTGLIAIQCLKQIFMAPNRAQIHGATTALVHFIRERVRAGEQMVKTNPKTSMDSGWAIRLFGLVARWAPVQDRYIILTATLDLLVNTEATLENGTEQAVLIAMMSSLLRSDVNLIGLSVMDVLLGLMQHLKKILKSSESASHQMPPNTTIAPGESSASDLESGNRVERSQELLSRIQRCIGDLATHVYYADQISDMISAVLLRLRPHPSVINNATAPDGVDHDPALAVSSGTLSDDQQADTFFSFGAAKTAALKAIKAILLVANTKTKSTSDTISLSRNKVSIQAWERTHWLLRDPDLGVRTAYVDALITWLDRETTRADLKAQNDSAQKPPRAGNRESNANGFARRAVSNATPRDKPTKIPRSRFLLLIHIAIYDNVLQHLDNEPDVILCHILLSKLVTKLGVNAVRYGLPMIFRLQEDILEVVEPPLSKVRLGSVCHGYFWLLSEKFDFESTPNGQAIHNEISRRKSKHFWVEGISLPPPAVETINAHPPLSELASRALWDEALHPFDERSAIVDHVCANYQESSASPPTSPTASPTRSFAHPILGSTFNALPSTNAEIELPPIFRQNMLTEWTREGAVAALQEGSKSTSLNGSRAATTTTKGGLLAVNGQSGVGSPVHSHHNLRPGSNGGGLGKASLQSRGSARSNSSRPPVTSVDQLKSMLAGDPNVRPMTAKSVAAPDDSSSDSMVSYEYSPSELSYNPPQNGAEDHNHNNNNNNNNNIHSQPSTSTVLARSRSKSRERRASGDLGGPLTSHPTHDDDDDEDVPPVPPLPDSIPQGSAAFSNVGQRPRASSTSTPGKTPKRNLRSRGGESTRNVPFGGLGDLSNGGAGGMSDLQSLLKGIDSKAHESSLGNLTQPPY